MKEGIFNALIAVRKGSQRIKDKNIKQFSASSLLEIKVRQAIENNSINEVFVSSDCKRMLQLARELGATTINREAKYCSNIIPMNEVYEHLANSVSGDHIVYLHVTSPLLEDSTLESCIQAYKQMDARYDSLATVAVSYTHLRAHET